MDKKQNNSDDSSINENINDVEILQTEMIPPDGGWGWIILIGNCILMFLLPTSPVCYGVVYLALVEQQGISNTTASGITAVLLGIATFLGPVSTALASFYTHRRLALIGVSLMAIGLLFCSFSLNIIWLYFAFILIGFGNSLGTPQIFLIGQEYFTTKRVTANALASAAYTAGYVVLPIILINLIYTYSLRGAFLVWAAIMLNGLIGAMLYQPIERHLKPKRASVSHVVTFSDNIHTIEEGVEYGNENDCNAVNTDYNHYNGYVDSKNVQINSLPYSHEKKSHYFDNISHERNIRKDTDSFQSVNEEGDNFMDSKYEEELQTNLLEGRNLHKFTNRIKEERPCSFVSTTSIDSYCTAKTSFISMLSVAQSEYFDVNGSWLSIQSTEDCKPLNGSVLDIPEKKVYPGITPDLPVGRQKRKSHRLCGISFPYFSDIVNLEVLTSPVFLIIAISSAVYRQVYYGYSSFLPIIAFQKQLEEKIPILLFILAVAEIISKFGTGFIADRGWIAAKHLYMGSTLVNSFALILTALSTNLTSIAVATSILGIGLGISSALGPVLLVKYHSLELLPYSYGLMLFLSGATTFVLLPIQGWTIDKTGSANYVCYIFASLCIIPLFLWSLMPIAQKYIKRSKINEEN